MKRALLLLALCNLGWAQRNFEVSCPAGSSDMEGPTFNPSTSKFRSWLCVDPNGVVTSPAFGAGQTGVLIPVITSGLIAEYRFTEGTGTTAFDTSGQGNNGTLSGGVTWNTSAQGLGISLNGASQFISVPNTVNSFLTMIVVMQFQSNNQSVTLPAIVCGNANAQQLWLGMTSLTAASGGAQTHKQIGGGMPLMSWYGAAVQDYSFYSPSGTHIVGMVLGGNGSPGTDAWYVQSALDQSQSVGPLTGNWPAAQGANRVTAGNLQIGGCSNTGAIGLNTWLTGQIYYASFYNRQLSAGEMAQNFEAINTNMRARGITFPGFSKTAVDQFVASGDSLTIGGQAGFGATDTWLKYTTLTTGTWNTADIAQGGIQVGQFFGSPATGVLGDDQHLASTNSWFATIGGRNVITLWAGTNDIFQGATAQQTFSGLQYLTRQYKVQGWRVIVSSMISRTTVDAGKNSYNALIRAYWPTFADGFADLAADPNLGADGANANASFFQADGIHLLLATDINNVVPIMQRAVNRQYGNLSFSTAATYASAAPAATATTAGSESGNTVTLTFGTAPCSQGNTITVAGVTPAGYNGNYTVLTRSATQITYFNNTTGLGAISVQGTGVCPQQQDADVYTLLNFGAGNFTLEDCLGWTGQNLYIKNINAVGSTIVPFGSETIDGAANLAIAAGATRIIQGVLVGPTTGNCNWRVVQ